MLSLRESILGSNGASLYKNSKYRKFFESIDKREFVNIKTSHLYGTIAYSAYLLAKEYTDYAGLSPYQATDVERDFEEILSKHPHWIPLNTQFDLGLYIYYNKVLADKYHITEKYILKKLNGKDSE